MNTIKNNDLIAEFMGWEIRPIPTEDDIWVANFSGDGKTYQFAGLVGEELFHKSWDWLMPVVEKIESIEDYMYDVEIRQSVCFIHGADVEIQSDLKIDAVYWAVIEFIKWYNKKEL